MSYRKMLVVSSARWLAEDLAAAGTVPVEHTLGLDAPVLDGSTALWCSWSWALRLARTGISHPFLSPGPDWLARLPYEYRRRDVWAGRIGDMPYKGMDPVFYKLAEHKHSGIPAGFHPDRGSFRRFAFDAFNFAPGVEDLRFIGSGPIAYVREYRCFIAHGKVEAASLYLSSVPGINDSTVEITWNAQDPAFARRDAAEAAVFAGTVSAALGDEQPPGYVLDVGLDTDGNWSVIEANAAWSSNIYHCDPVGAIRAILASQEPGHDRWTWKPDALFADRARPLPTNSILGREHVDDPA